MSKVIKRDASVIDFNKHKISAAILKAMKNGSGIVEERIAYQIADEIEQETKEQEFVDIYEIEDLVYDKLIKKGQSLTAKAYEGYRRIREFQRESVNTIDNDITQLLDGDSDYWKHENANKNAELNTTKRDYMAGIVSTDAVRRYLLSPEIVQAHDEGIIHFHDADYFLQHMHNCFHCTTKFYTSEGIKSFKDFKDGSTIRVLDKNGVFRTAIVKRYGKQSMNRVTFTTAQRKKEIICTKNHRWLLKDGSVTTDLKIGDTLLGIKEKNNGYPNSERECEMFALGFLIGDGCDHKGSNLHQIRLCGNKIKYASYIQKAGYQISSINNSKDLIAIKRGLKKQDFLNSYAWKYLSEDDKKWLFLGLYSADGAKQTNKISTSDNRVIELIKDISYAAGYYITSETQITHNTPYKENAKLTDLFFIIRQPENLCWKVQNIETYHNGTEYEAWCIEEPITHSFMLDDGMITGNCCVFNLEDMLQNGTVISEVLIEKPHSFSTACTITTQIIAQVASSQYGGQTISLAHLAPFVDISRQRIRKEVIAEHEVIDTHINGDAINYITEERLRKEITKGIQTIQYQLTTLMTCNGQAPFITIFMYLNEAKNSREKADLAILIKEVLNQRITGVKNCDGVYIAPAFPKLIYVLEEDNITEDSEYWYLTKLAAECSAKRLVPDYISEKMMLELKGDVYGCMGCVDGDEIVTYRYNNHLYVESFERMWDRLSEYFKVYRQDDIVDNPNRYIDLTGVEIYDTEKGFVNASRIIRNISKDWVDVHLSNGRRLLCTSDHPFEICGKGVVEASKLSESDKILVNSSQYYDERIMFEPDKAWLLGVMLCDGCYSSNHVYVSVAATGEDEIEDMFHKTFKKYFDLDTYTVLRERGKKGTYKDLIVKSNYNGDLQKAICYFTEKFGGLQKINRHIPSEVFSWNYESKLAFLAGMIDADGYINDYRKNGAIIQIGSTNKELALQQVALAQSLGMPAKIYHNHYNKKKPEAIRYRVEFYANDELMQYIVCNKKVEHYERTYDDHYNTYSEVKEVIPVDTIRYSYDVTTDSEHFEVSGIYSHNCRSFLTPDRFTDAGIGNIANAKNYEPGKHKYYGRLTV